MKNIEVNTAQNVTIRYELANVFSRGFALILDYSLLFIITFITFFLIESSDMRVSETFAILFFSIMWGAYSLYSELLFNGQSIGKIIMKIKIISLSGESLKFSNIFLRWIFRLLDFMMSFFVLGIGLIATSPLKQRLGDLMADTVVIKLNPAESFSIEQLKELKDANNYEARFANATMLNEEQMILVKQILNRYEQNKNKHHQSLLNQTSEKVKKALGIKKEIKDPSLFLKQVLKDYVILTR